MLGTLIRAKESLARVDGVEPEDLADLKSAYANVIKDIKEQDW